MHLVKYYELIKAVKNRLISCKTDLKEIYLGTIEECPERPSFLIVKAQSGNARSTFLTQKRLMSLQLIYFGPVDEVGKEDAKDHLNVIDQLSPFLDSFNLKVEDRVLTFSVDIGDADEQLSIMLDFKFNDSVVIDVQDYEMIQNISLNEEAIS